MKIGIDALFRPASAEAGENDLSVLPPGKPTMMIYALERDTQALAPVIKPLSRRFFRHKLVFVISALDFRPFMAEKAVFEVLPALDQIAAFPDLVNWPGYLEDRRALLVAKWAPRRAISYGMAFQDYVAASAQFAADRGAPRQAAV